MYKDNYNFYTRKGHPINNKLDISLKDVVEYELCFSILKGFNDNKPIAIDILSSLGLDVSVKLRSEVMSILINYVKHSDAILLGTETFIMDNKNDVLRVNMDMDNYDRYNESEGLYTSLFYHQSNRKNDKTIWLGEMIKSVFRDEGIKI
ncbi:hypothetical protein [Photobacterium minamisatsumaniensis]|uniref:hypothetical protein n=1 Tax=Photobacterium minamisatsumaniensis TaxID=2910233 RepID=UPI003D10AF2D